MEVEDVGGDFSDDDKAKKRIETQKSFPFLLKMYNHTGLDAK